MYSYRSIVILEHDPQAQIIIIWYDNTRCVTSNGCIIPAIRYEQCIDLMQIDTQTTIVSTILDMVVRDVSLASQFLHHGHTPVSRRHPVLTTVH